MPRRLAVIAGVLALVCACTAALPQPVASPPSPAAPSSPEMPGAGPTAATSPSSPSPSPSRDPLLPRAIPAIAWPVDIEASLVLGKAADGTAILLDLHGGSFEVLPFGHSSNLRDLGAGVVVGTLPSSNRKRTTALVYDVDTGATVPLGFAERGDSDAMVTDGALVAGTAVGVGLFVYDLATGRLREVDYPDGKNRVVVSAMSGDRIAGTHGLFDNERAWLYDLTTGTGTDLHALADGSNSWANDMDGDLVVGEVETPITFGHRPWIYDAGTDTMTDLGSRFEGSTGFLAVEPPLVLGVTFGESRIETVFAYNLVTGEVTPLPGLPGSEEGQQGSLCLPVAISGNLALGRCDRPPGGGSAASIAAVWDLSSLQLMHRAVASRTIGRPPMTGARRRRGIRPDA